MPNRAVAFDDLWKKWTYFALVPLEEGQFKVWTWGRFACLGDSVHKMTPNAGQGGNAAIESAAAPANQIYLLLEETKGAGPTYDQIKRSLSGFQARLDQRISAILKTSNDLTRAHALKSVAARIMVQYFVPQMGDYLVDLLSDMYIGAELLEFLPPPHRFLLATMPFNLTQGLGKHESRLRRALWALPLLAMSALTVRTMTMAGLMYPVFHGIFETSRFEWKGVF